MSQSTNQATVDAKAKIAETKKRFLDVWPTLEGQLVDLMKTHGMPEDATKWYRDVRWTLFFHPFSKFLIFLDAYFAGLEFELQYPAWEAEPRNLCRRHL